MQGNSTLAMIDLGVMTPTFAFSAATWQFPVDAAGDQFAVLYLCRKAMAVDELALRLSVLSGTPTYTVSLQGVDANGFPDGTALGGASPASTQFSPTVNGLQWITLDNAYTVALDEMVALVVEDGSPPNINASNFANLDAAMNQFGMTQPYTAENSGGGYSKRADLYPLFGLRDSADTGDVQGFPVHEMFKVATIVAGSGDRAMVEFTLPAELGPRVEIHGVNVPTLISTADYKVGLWDASGTQVVISGTQDKDHKAGSTVSGTFFFSPTWLDTGVAYRMGCEQVGAGIMLLYSADCLTDDNLSAFARYNSGLINYAGGWWGTKTTGQAPLTARLLVSDFDRGSSGRVVGMGMGW